MQSLNSAFLPVFWDFGEINILQYALKYDASVKMALLNTKSTFPDLRVAHSAVRLLESMLDATPSRCTEAGPPNVA